MAERPAACRFQVRLTPRGGRDGIDGVGPAGELRVRVAAPPVDGAANGALVRLLAGAMGIAPRAVEIEAGTTGRVKRIRAAGVSAESLLALWPGLAVAGG